MILYFKQKKRLIIHNYICIVGCPDFHPALYEKQSGKIETKKNYLNIVQIMKECGLFE